MIRFPISLYFIAPLAESVVVAGSIGFAKLTAQMLPTSLIARWFPILPLFHGTVIFRLFIRASGKPSAPFEYLIVFQPSPRDGCCQICRV
jgi:hypothetical protein